MGDIATGVVALGGVAAGLFTLGGVSLGLLLALGALFLASLIFRMAAVGPVLAWLFYFLLSTAMLSVGLGLFNLIPIPPLDGSKVLFALLPDRAY